MTIGRNIINGRFVSMLDEVVIYEDRIAVRMGKIHRDTYFYFLNRQRLS